MERDIQPKFEQRRYDNDKHRQQRSPVECVGTASSQAAIPFRSLWAGRSMWRMQRERVSGGQGDSHADDQHDEYEAAQEYYGRRLEHNQPALARTAFPRWQHLKTPTHYISA